MKLPRKKIFTSIDKIKGMPTIIRESYLTLKKIDLDEYRTYLIFMKMVR